jgi:hypothetical protein
LIDRFFKHGFEKEPEKPRGDNPEWNGEPGNGEGRSVAALRELMDFYES